ncbi:hypothetical protein BKA83DRAFT_4127550 [Pisolithus microcarpus]|nr:hypothetical protein BKA83DRAFT_4127550 [Pisolithus microcarpus]
MSKGRVVTKLTSLNYDPETCVCLPDGGNSPFKILSMVMLNALYLSLGNQGALAIFLGSMDVSGHNYTTIGTVKTVIGAIVNVQFESDDLPPIINTLEVQDFHNGCLVPEVGLHLGKNTVHTIAMDSMEGLHYNFHTILRA